jgi:hypothetical protein
MYCLDISTPATPVACTSQPYAINTGITGTMPTYNGTSFNSQREIINGNIYFVINYATQSPAIDSRISCFDPTTTARCAGWTSADAPNAISGTNLYHTIFSYLDTSGVSQAVCANQRLIDPILCFDLTTGASASAPNIFSLAPAGKSNYVFEELVIGTKAYFPIGWPAGTTSAALCWDFATQGACSGFGTNGYKPWDGSDGGTAVNGGDTRDYGYAISNGCMYGLGDAGVLWSFDPDTGSVPGSASCAVAGETTSNTTGTSPGLPNSGSGPLAKKTPWSALSAVVFVAAPVGYLIRKVKFVSSRR